MLPLAANKKPVHGLRGGEGARLKCRLLVLMSFTLFAFADFKGHLPAHAAEIEPQGDWLESSGPPNAESSDAVATDKTPPHEFPETDLGERSVLEDTRPIPPAAIDALVAVEQQVEAAAAVSDEASVPGADPVAGSAASDAEIRERPEAPSSMDSGAAEPDYVPPLGLETTSAPNGEAR
jgi:hypothetical protein